MAWRTAQSDSFPGAAAGEEREVGGVRLCWCPAGRFRMGSPADEPGRCADETQVDVELTRGFWMGKFEVTQAEWKQLMGEIPGPLVAGEGDRYPVYWINFPEAEEFCRKLTEHAQARRASCRRIGSFVCRRRRSGNMLAGPGPRRPFRLAAR